MNDQIIAHCFVKRTNTDNPIVGFVEYVEDDSDGAYASIYWSDGKYGFCELDYLEKIKTPIKVA